MWPFKKKKKTEVTQIIKKNKLPYKAGLSLAGGGARGFGHVGVLKAFEEENIVFDYVTGTSAGSMVGALYALGFTSQQIIEFGKSLKAKDLRPISSVLISAPSKNIETQLNKVLGGVTFDKLQIPFSCVAVNIATGEEVVLSKGLVAPAVTASCAAPIFFKPAVIDGVQLVDGGLLNTMPADIVRQMGAEIVISVDINSKRAQGTTSSKLLNVLVATWRIATSASAYKGYMNSDLVIQPDLDRFKATSLDQDIDEMVEEGYKAAKEQMPQIKKLLGIIK
ncbi:MAG: patatin-like phospholipase family protein [Clostridia bacterium]